MIHCEWDLNGIEALRKHVAALVIVDVLSFSTAVDVAVGRGARVIPFPLGDQEAAQAAADEAGARLAWPRKAGGTQLSLSPASLSGLGRGDRLVLPSPNGSRLSLAGDGVPVLTGCLRNARAVAAKAQAVAAGGAIAVIPAGERWPDGTLRPAIEDLVGAGAIIDALDGALTAEARIARDAFRAAATDLPDLIRSSLSGQELIRRGFGEDVELALQLSVSTTAPIMRTGAYCDANADG